MEADFIADLFAPFSEVRTRRMFGGIGVWRDGVMYALAVDCTVYLKADADTAERLRAAGSEPFVYERRGRPVALSYWRLPEAALDDPDELVDWAGLAFAAAFRARPAGKRR